MDRISQILNSLNSKPSLQRYVLYAVVLLAAIYIVWSVWGSRTQTPGQGFHPAAPAVATDKVPGPVVRVKVIPKAKVKRELPDAHIDGPGIEVIDTAVVPPAPNGATTVTTIDQTGEAKTEVKINPAPWFAFERNNTLGSGYRVGTEGPGVPIFYRRDILRIKDVHLVGEVGAFIPVGPGKAEGHGAALIEWRF